ncbi:hypothetical protein F8B43_5658 [Methylorubrum populi]|uniref:Acylphosphatase-like domain-containing protein n=1 Tax=Methylorubrum populi TaxID=223967 RepID=A0A833J0K3_9HYPH|nr:hypothetical protein F8B43_5658 [Methylorubrum populi]
MKPTDDSTVETAEIQIRGRIDAEAFREFVSLYSRRLDLQGECELVDVDALTIVVRGRKALVAMLATACSLGPARSMVHDIRISVRPNDPSSLRQQSRAPDSY